MIHSLVHREADFAPSSVRGIVYLPCRPVSAEALRCGGRGRFSSWKAGVAQHGHGVGRHEDEVSCRHVGGIVAAKSPIPARRRQSLGKTDREPWTGRTKSCEKMKIRPTTTAEEQRSRGAKNGAH